MQDIRPSSLPINQRTGSPCWTSLSTIQKLSCRMRKTSLGASALKNVKEKVYIAWKVCPITIFFIFFMDLHEIWFQLCTLGEEKIYFSKTKHQSTLQHHSMCLQIKYNQILCYHWYVKCIAWCWIPVFTVRTVPDSQCMGMEVSHTLS